MKNFFKWLWSKIKNIFNDIYNAPLIDVTHFKDNLDDLTHKKGNKISANDIWELVKDMLKGKK